MGRVTNDIFNFIMSYNLLPKRKGFSPIEVLKGGILPQECLLDLSDKSAPSKQSSLSAGKFIEEIWEFRSAPKLDAMKPNRKQHEFKVGDQVIWQAQINPATFRRDKGTIQHTTPTAALIRFTNRRLAWCSITQIKRDPDSQLHRVLD